LVVSISAEDITDLKHIDLKSIGYSTGCSQVATEPKLTVTF
jgi:hypothetical protein